MIPRQRRLVGTGALVATVLLSALIGYLMLGPPSQAGDRPRVPDTFGRGDPWDGPGWTATGPESESSDAPAPDGSGTSGAGGPSTEATPPSDGDLEASPAEPDPELDGALTDPAPPPHPPEGDGELDEPGSEGAEGSPESGISLELGGHDCD